MLSRFKKNK